MRGESKSIVSVLRVYTADPCPEVVLTIVSSLPTFLDHFAAHVHMVAESIVPDACHSAIPPTAFHSLSFYLCSFSVDIVTVVYPKTH